MKELSKSAQDIIMDSWSTNTKKTYTPYLKEWAQYIQHKRIPLQVALTDVNVGIEFLTHLFYNRNISYSVVNNARSALSAIMDTNNGVTFGKEPLVKRLLKGMFRKRPQLPRYTVTYDAKAVLMHLSSLSLQNITLKQITQKTATMLCLLTSQRDQSLHELDINYLHIDDTKMVFYIPAILKTTTPTFHTKPLELKRYKNKNICVVETVIKYCDMTKDIRLDDKLFVATVPPHKGVKTETISRWVRETLGEAGVDIVTFSSHSTRSAATSCAKAQGVSIKEIGEAAGWTNCETFARFYDRPIIKNFGEAVMSCLDDTNDNTDNHFDHNYCMKL